MCPKNLPGSAAWNRVGIEAQRGLKPCTKQGPGSIQLDSHKAKDELYLKMGEKTQVMAVLMYIFAETICEMMFKTI